MLPLRMSGNIFGLINTEEAICLPASAVRQEPARLIAVKSLVRGAATKECLIASFPPRSSKLYNVCSLALRTI